MRHAVMVSSTYTDLKDLRQVLLDAALSAGLYPEAMEHDAALVAPDVIESSLGKVERAAGYVLLIGHRYGQRPVSASNPEQLSITELEFERAVRCGRPSVVLMLGDDYPLGRKHIDQSQELVTKLEAFRARAKSMDGSGSGVHRVYKVVNNETELREAAITSLRNLADELHARAAPAPPQPAAPARVADGLPLPPCRYAVPAYIASHEFVGRDAELALLGDWSAPEDAHPVMLFDAIGGSGKSMLTWHWFEQRAPGRRGDWAGRFWYSFYEAGASMADCCRHALAYITQRPLSDFHKRPTADLARELLERLRERPWLLVLDGLERVLVAYHRSDAATIADEALDQPSDQIAERNPCAAAHQEDDALLRQLSSASPSKVLVSSRLMPQALLNPAHQPIPGVRREPLRGLRPEDAVLLLQRCGVRGDPMAMQRFVQANCDGHPLVVGALAGLIVEPIPAAGDFDAWVNHPAGGAALDLGALDLTQKRNHILRAALAAVPRHGRELLQTLALLHGGVDRIALEALNPHRPPEPEAVEEPLRPEGSALWARLNDEQKSRRLKLYKEEEAERNAYLQRHAAWQASPELKAATAALAATLRDLQRRGLLQVGEGKDPRFDLHPVVRGVVSAGLGEGETERLGQRVVDHFSRRAHSPYEQAQTFQDLEGGFHIVRTLLRMGQLQQAFDAWRGGLADAVSINVLGWHETLALLKPFFPNGWLQFPQGVDERSSSSLMNDVGWALGETGLVEQAVQVYAIKLQANAARRDAVGLGPGLRNMADMLARVNRLPESQACQGHSLRLAEALGEGSELFQALLSDFLGASLVGDWPRAEASWARAERLGRNWPRDMCPPGEQESLRAANLWCQGKSPREPLAMAERLARDARARSVLLRVLQVRGEFSLAEGAANDAVAAFDEAARLKRASGLVDLDTESWLALASARAGQQANPRAEAERLQAAGAKGYALARLWQEAGDLTQARAQALVYYREAWAAGEPYVWRFYLERARKLLADLGEPEPQLPPYDPARHPPFDWEDEVLTVIRELEARKAERNADDEDDEGDAEQAAPPAH